MIYRYSIWYSYIENNDIHRCHFKISIKKKIKYDMASVIDYISKYHKIEYIHIDNIQYIGMRSQ